MQVYRCQHCGRELGPLVENEPQPACPDHPDGVVEVTGDADSQPE